MEIIVALMISFLNVRNEMRNRNKSAENDFEDAMEIQKNIHPKYPSQHFVRNFFVLMALFGVLNFGCRMDFAGKMISGAILMPSLPIAVLCLSILSNAQSAKKKQKRFLNRVIVLKILYPTIFAKS
ncbi:MAG TPA: hypothetical protein VFL76_06200 [Edaphocola sp.]|nr:hypothetical protein [Edaphocola sp.]